MSFSNPGHTERTTKQKHMLRPTQDNGEENPREGVNQLNTSNKRYLLSLPELVPTIISKLYVIYQPISRKKVNAGP